MGQGFLVDGVSVFGILFPALFLVAVWTVSLGAYMTLMWAFNEGTPKDWVFGATELLKSVAVMIGSLQTVISLCVVGYSILFGSLEAGPKAFGFMIQGFASTGFGIATAIFGSVSLWMFRPRPNEGGVGRGAVVVTPRALGGVSRWNRFFGGRNGRRKAFPE